MYSGRKRLNTIEGQCEIFRASRAAAASQTRLPKRYLFDGLIFFSVQAKTTRHVHKNACVNFQAGVGVIRPRTDLCCVIYGATPCPMYCIRHNTHLASDNMRATSVHVIKWRRGSDSEQQAVFCAPCVIEALSVDNSLSFTRLWFTLSRQTDDVTTHAATRPHAAYCKFLLLAVSGGEWPCHSGRNNHTNGPTCDALPATPPTIYALQPEGSAPTLATPRAQAPDDANDA